jgi:peptidoglycan/xylan/chitin deacetylase (PgdA/CDA1 family)
MSKNVVLTFDDAVVNHLSFVVPLLLEYGFGATFFVCRSAKWLTEHPDCYLAWRDIRKIGDAGFEIGNHTLSHVDLGTIGEADGRRDVAELNSELAAHGIPAPESFAYPGGPYAESAAKWLGEYGLSCARTTGKALWTGSTDFMNIAGYSVNAREENNFHAALSDLAAVGGELCAAVLIYHGVPDTAHPWCSTPPEMFKRHMDILRYSGCRVMSMRDCRRLMCRRAGQDCAAGIRRGDKITGALFPA